MDRELEKRLKKISMKAVKLGKDIVKELGPYSSGVCINTVTSWKERDRYVVFSMSICDSEEMAAMIGDLLQELFEEIKRRVSDRGPRYAV